MLTCDVSPTGKQVQLLQMVTLALAMLEAPLQSQTRAHTLAGVPIPSLPSPPSPPSPHLPGDLSTVPTSFVTVLPMIVSWTTDSVDNGHLQLFPFPPSPTASSAQTTRTNSTPTAFQIATPCTDCEPIPANQNSFRYTSASSTTTTTARQQQQRQ